MSFHPLKTLGTVGARMRSALAACILVALTIAAMECVEHPHTVGHAHGTTLALPQHVSASAEFSGAAPHLPYSAEICVPAGRSLTAGQETAPSHASAPAVPLTVAVSVWPLAARRRPLLRPLAANGGRFTLISVCRWRI